MFLLHNCRDRIGGLAFETTTVSFKTRHYQTMIVETNCAICGVRPAGNSVANAVVGGSTTVELLCDDCANANSLIRDVKRILTQGKCQFCSAHAMVVDGLPPYRLIMCHDCATRKYQPIEE